ncbi:MAG: hypothetical protein FWF41_06435 [Betaproteobacteria bacterium]|nr:hypothetical protein [Betaproteobacteria bacterium]
MSKLVSFDPFDVFFFRIEKGRNAFEAGVMPLADIIGSFMLPAPPFPGSLGYDLQMAKQFCYGRLWALAFARYCGDSGADIVSYRDGLGGSVFLDAVTSWMHLLPRCDISKSPFILGVFDEIEAVFIEGGGAWLDGLTPERWNEAAREVFAAEDSREAESVLLRLKSDLKQDSNTANDHA